MALTDDLLHKINNKTKPQGALGQLEQLALQIGRIQQTTTPVISNPAIIVFAADHGIAATGKVNPYPQAVTAQMVLNFVNGGAAINVFCRQNNIQLTVVDAGVNADFDPSLPIVHAKIAKGTADYSLQPAMTTEQAEQAIDTGKTIVKNAVHTTGCNTIGFGEMGIGNTAAASLIMHHYTQLPLHECVGRGTGANDTQLAAKLAVLENVVRYHQLSGGNITAMELLCKAGGFEIAMMAGAYISAFEHNMVIVADGFISTAALLIADQLLATTTQHSLLHNCVFAHSSDELGHKKMLAHLHATPLLQLGMRLGEGTGAALAMPLLQAAVNFLNEMASFETAGVSNRV